MLLQEQSTKTKMSDTKTAIMIIGGAEDRTQKSEILHTFFYRSGSTDASIAIIPSASQQPALNGGQYVKLFETMGAKQIELLDLRRRKECMKPNVLAYLEACTGVFLTGGDQLRLTDILANTPAIEIIRSRVQQGQLTLAGTSAGAAIMGHHMISGGCSGEPPNRSMVELTTGLGILPRLIVDQHFHNRNRMARLVSALCAHPDKLGIGIDEDTCAMVESDGLLQVVGKGTVTIINPCEMSYTNCSCVEPDKPLSVHNLRVHILSHGDRYHLHQGTVFAPTAYALI
jgi:cyanophycinase